MELRGLDHERLAIEKERSVAGLETRLVGIIVRTPALLPGNRHAVAAEVYGQPHIAGILKVLLVPAVEHGNVKILLADNRLHIRALRVECLVGIRAGAGIAKHSPLAHNRIGDSNLGLVGIPARATR